jgi:hypothetical protein
MVKLLKVVRSTNPKKKYTALFDDGKKTSFGASGYQDYTQHHDRERREAYRRRHQDDLDTDDPTRAGFLSYYILWGDSINIDSNIAAYKRKFNM